MRRRDALLTGPVADPDNRQNLRKAMRLALLGRPVYMMCFPDRADLAAVLQENSLLATLMPLEEASRPNRPFGGPAESAATGPKSPGDWQYYTSTWQCWRSAACRSTCSALAPWRCLGAGNGFGVIAGSKQIGGPGPHPCSVRDGRSFAASAAGDAYRRSTSCTRLVTSLPTTSLAIIGPGGGQYLVILLATGIRLMEITGGGKVTARLGIRRHRQTALRQC